MTVTEQSTPYTWTLTPDQYQATVEKIAAINTRAARRGFTGRLEIVGVRTVETVTRHPAPPRERVVYQTTLTGTPPAYAGWQMLAAVDALTTDGGSHEFLLRCAPGVNDEDVDRTLLEAGRCEHCNTRRPNRRHTYLVRHGDTGSVKQVGSTCLKDFLGWSGSPVFLSIRDTAEDLEAGFGSGRDEYTPGTVLGYAYAAVEILGWAPSSFDSSTKAAVDEALYGRGRAADELRAKLQPHLADGIQLAPAIIDTLLCELTGEHGYEANLRAALRAGSVGPRELGLLCSAIPVYQRIIGAARAAREKKATVPSAWLGDIGEKLTLTGVITIDLTVDGYAHGTTQRLLVINTPEGTVKIITAAQWSYDASAGDEVTVTGTVKAHEFYGDHKQTRLVRPRRVDAPPAPADR